MQENRIVLSLGSNRERERNIDRAQALLTQTFDAICFSERLETEPYGSFAGAAPFLNQVAIAYTPLAIEELQPLLKTIEKEIGRTPEDKPRASISIDIDLLLWNDCLLKPDDWGRDYIQTLVRGLLIP